MASAIQRLQQVQKILTSSTSTSTSTSTSGSTITSTSGSTSTRFKIAVIGSGNWGTTIAKILAENTREQTEQFQRQVDMWVFEEKVNGRNLTEIINQEHENVRYLPEIKLPDNLVANANIVEVAQSADLLVFNLPHQFLPKICEQLKGHVKPHARAISCLKGLEVSGKGCKSLSSVITEKLGIACGVLSGANLAPEISRGKWSETTVAYPLPRDFQGPGHDVDHEVLKSAFHRTYFHVRVIEDVAGVSVAGALKNVVALAVGFVEGLGWGDNAKAAIMRIGLVETIRFSQAFFPESNASTFTQESAGVADLITTCSAGRNVKVARHMAQTGDAADVAEKKLLQGQSSQGIVTAREVHELLTNVQRLDEFPLFETTYQIIAGNEKIENFPKLLERD